MKKALHFLLSVLSCAVFLVGTTACGGANGDGQGSGGEILEPQRTQLQTPSLTLVGNKATWENIPNASSYRYKIGEDGEERVTVDLFVLLSHGQTVYVKAVGDREFYLDSEWSIPATYSKTSIALPKPTFSRTGNVLSWLPITGATAYEYKFELDGVVKTTNETTLVLEDYCEVYVRALGDGLAYTTGLWGTHYYDAPIPLSVEQGTVHLDNSTGVVTWEKSVLSIRYEYRIDNGVVQDGGSRGSITLIDGQTIAFRAVGDGDKYSNSEWFLLKYTQSGGNAGDGFQ